MVTGWTPGFCSSSISRLFSSNVSDDDADSTGDFDDSSDTGLSSFARLSLRTSANEPDSIVVGPSQELLSNIGYDDVMKRIALVALAFVLAPVVGAAQQDATPPGPPPDGAPMTAPNPQRMAAMRQVRQQMMQLRTQTRTQMLAALTPQHRTAIANLLGEAAVSPNPDPHVVAQRIDALLTRSEAQNVVNVAASERANVRTMMESARAQFVATLSPDEQAKMKEREAAMAARPRPQREERTPDPGRELLRTILGFTGGGDMHGGPRGFGGPGPAEPPGGMGEPHP